VDLPALDRRSVVPLYFQIQQHLLEQIKAGRLKPGSPIPSEQEISARLRISRMTARQALKSLCGLGVTYSERGKGTFVARVKLEKNSRQLLSFSEEMSAVGSQPRSRVLEFEEAEATSDVAEALHLGPEERVVSLRRVRMTGSTPMGVEWSRLPSRLCGGLLEMFKPTMSLYETLARSCGIHIAAAEEVVEVGLAKAEEAKLLKFAKGSPVFLFTRTAYSQDGKPVEYVKSTYRGDRFKMVNRLSQAEKRKVGKSWDGDSSGAGEGSPEAPGIF
jgi:GntR family transcriptional regulator